MVFPGIINICVAAYTRHHARAYASGALCVVSMLRTTGQQDRSEGSAKLQNPFELTNQRKDSE